MNTAMNCRPTLSLLLILLLFSGAIAAAPEARTYQMAQRSAEGVAQQIRELYPDGQVSITARGQQMVVRGEPEVLDELGRLVVNMDVAPSVPALSSLSATLRLCSTQDTWCTGPFRRFPHPRGTTLPYASESVGQNVKCSINVRAHSEQRSSTTYVYDSRTHVYSVCGHWRVRRPRA